MQSPILKCQSKSTKRKIDSDNSSSENPEPWFKWIRALGGSLNLDIEATGSEHIVPDIAVVKNRCVASLLSEF